MSDRGAFVLHSIRKAYYSINLPRLRSVPAANVLSTLTVWSAASPLTRVSEYIFPRHDDILR